MSEVSTDMRSLRSKRVGPLTESEIPIEKKENQSRKVRHRAGHGYDEGAVISTQFKESVETVTQRQGLVSSGGEYKEQMSESQLTKKERDNAPTMWAISVVAYSCCQPECTISSDWKKLSSSVAVCYCIENLEDPHQSTSHKINQS